MITYLHNPIILSWRINTLIKCAIVTCDSCHIIHFTSTLDSLNTKNRHNINFASFSLFSLPVFHIKTIPLHLEFKI